MLWSHDDWVNSVMQQIDCNHQHLWGGFDWEAKLPVVVFCFMVQPSESDLHCFFFKQFWVHMQLTWQKHHMLNFLYFCVVKVSLCELNFPSVWVSPANFVEKTENCWHDTGGKHTDHNPRCHKKKCEQRGEFGSVAWTNGVAFSKRLVLLY